MGATVSSDQSAKRYVLAPAIRVSFTAEGATLLDTARGTIISMNGSAAELLRALRDGASLDVLSHVLAAFDGAPSREVVEAELRTFLNDGFAAKFIEEHAS